MPECQMTQIHLKLHPTINSSISRSTECKSCYFNWSTLTGTSNWIRPYRFQNWTNWYKRLSLLPSLLTLVRYSRDSTPRECKSSTKCYSSPQLPLTSLPVVLRGVYGCSPWTIPSCPPAIWCLQPPVHLECHLLTPQCLPWFCQSCCPEQSSLWCVTRWSSTILLALSMTSSSTEAFVTKW